MNYLFLSPSPFLSYYEQFCFYYNFNTFYTRSCQTIHSGKRDAPRGSTLCQCDNGPRSLRPSSFKLALRCFRTFFTSPYTKRHVTHMHHCGFNAYQFDPVTTLLLMLFQPWLYPFRNHRLGVSRWQAIGWRLPLGVSHWLPHRPFAQESRQSHYLTASFSPHPLWLSFFFVLTFIHTCNPS
jgi:hypothetical protein